MTTNGHLVSEKMYYIFAIRKLNCPCRLRSLTNRNKIKKIFVDYLSLTQFLITLVPIVQEVCNKSITTSAKCGAGIAYPSGTPMPNT